MTSFEVAEPRAPRHRRRVTAPWAAATTFGRAGWVGVLAAAVAGLLAWAPPATFGGFNATVTNSAGSTGTSTYFTCSNAAVGESATKAYFAYALAETTGLTAADSTGNNRTGSYAATGIAYATSGPCPRDTPASRSVTLNGTSGEIAGPTTAQTNPTVFSIEIWFNTTAAQGKLIGFGQLRTGTSSNYDRHLYIDSTGVLVFGVYPNAVKTVASTSKVNDGVWHHAVGTLSSAGQYLYLDGSLVASTAAVTTAQNYTGYWRIGYDNLNGWPNRPSSFFFNGSLAWASVYTYALSATQVSAHYRAGL
jgi:hypothetical protein